MSEEKKFLEDILWNLLLFDSRSSNEGASLRYIENLLNEFGIEFMRQELESDSYNLIINPKQKPDLLIATHIDVVSPYLPPKRNQDKLFGRGAVDVKNGASILLTLAQFADIPKNVSLAIFSLEETSGMGSRKYLARFKPKRVLIIEPTELKIANAGFGYVEGRIIIKGFSTHPNSIIGREKLVNPILNFIELHGKISSYLKNINFPFTYSSITSEGPEAATPEEVRVSIEIMLPPDKKLEAIFHLSELLRKNNAHFYIEDYSPGFKNRDKQFEEMVIEAYKKALKIEPEISTMLAWTDANTFGQVGIPAIVFGPGSLNVAHSYDEKISIDEIYSAYLVLKKLLEMI